MLPPEAGRLIDARDIHVCICMQMYIDRYMYIQHAYACMYIRIPLSLSLNFLYINTYLFMF